MTRLDGKVAFVAGASRNAYHGEWICDLAQGLIEGNKTALVVCL